MFSEYKCGFDEITTLQIKELQTKTKAANSFQLKGNKVQFEFNSGLLQLVNMASSLLLEALISTTHLSQQMDKLSGFEDRMQNFFGKNILSQRRNER